MGFKINPPTNNPIEEGFNKIAKDGEEVIKKGEEVVNKGKEAVNQAGSDAKENSESTGNQIKKDKDKAEKEVRKVVSTAVAAGGSLVGAKKKPVQGVPQANENEPGKALPYEERKLKDDERKLAQKVFGNVLPYGAIYLSTGLGDRSRPYTIPHPAIWDSYVIHIGPDVYKNATDSKTIVSGDNGDSVLIHELTHVWQGQYWKNRFDYVVDSLYHQARDGKAAYDFVEGGEWSRYTAEQQAEIVETWYDRGMKESDPLFPYIRDNIRKGKN